MRFDTLEAWLSWQEGLHPSAMDLGLERVRRVAADMPWPEVRPFPLIVVAGTNGKGSSVAYLDAIYTAAGFRTGTYTSPHLQRYNERICIGREEASDEALMEAFARLDEARKDLTITYFEYGTLAAMDLFVRSEVDVAIMEVGIGGRLDAVNIFDSDCALVTAVDIDHRKWLGDTREAIGLQKAGIFRAGKPAVCSDPSPPESLCDHAQELGISLRLLGRDFVVSPAGPKHWRFAGHGEAQELPLPGLPGAWQQQNAAGALAVVEALSERLPVTTLARGDGVRAPGLRGRLHTVRTAPRTIVDVGHNPQAVRSIATYLRETAINGKTLAVVAMLADKDIEPTLAQLRPQIDAWYVGSTCGPRGMRSSELAAALREGMPEALRVTSAESVTDAYRYACAAATEADRIIVFGSFHTVGEVMDALDFFRQAG
jgi:dihydrofolate synthase / folylpolyglutamate synthase